MALDLDGWLPNPIVRTSHRREAAVDGKRLWAAAKGVRLRDTPRLARVVRWRLPGTRPDMTFLDLFGRYPFVVLDAGEGWSISGLCGRVWTFARDYPRIRGADDFRAWREPGTVRVVFAHWVQDDGDGRSALVSESRIEPVDRRAALRTRALWAVVGRFDRLVGGEALEAAARRAQGG